jgi:hypothetical protein
MAAWPHIVNLGRQWRCFSTKHIGSQIQQCEQDGATAASSNGMATRLLFQARRLLLIIQQRRAYIDSKEQTRKMNNQKAYPSRLHNRGSFPYDGW